MLAGGYQTHDHMKKRNIALALGGAVGAAVAVKLLTREDTVRWESVADQVPHSDHSHFVHVDGALVHYQEFGDASKPPIVLIHGYTASVYVWKTAAPMLALPASGVCGPGRAGGEFTCGGRRSRELGWRRR